MRKRCSILWITDPWDTLDHARDTSLRLIAEGLQLGIESHWCDVKTIRLQKNKILLDSRQALPGMKFRAPKSVTPDVFSHLVYRTDPPVDLAYLHPLQLLRLGLQAHPTSEIINGADILCGWNEKTIGTLIPGLMPVTLVATDWETFLKFGQKEKRTVLKPLHEAQSKGVELLHWKTTSDLKRSKKLLQKVTDGFTRPALLQRYLPGIEKAGEKRLWFINGKLLAVSAKLPGKGTFRIDMDAGGHMAKAKLNKREIIAGKKVGSLLEKLGIKMAAVDLIDGLVTDFNFTSPGLLIQMEQITGRNLAREILLTMTQ